MHSRVNKIVSGGQTGVDRAALDAAIDLGIEHGGWCPKGRLAEDGVIDAKYQLVELTSSDYAVRTEQNVIDSDGTLIFYRERLTGGTALTNRLAKRHAKPLLRVRLDREVDCDRVLRWLSKHSIAELNVAGPRGSSDPSIASDAYRVIKAIFGCSPPLPFDRVDSADGADG